MSIASRVRAHHRARARANDSMIAMMVATELALDRLSASEEEAKLVDVAKVARTRHRLDRTVGDARPILQAAEGHLAFMAIPFVLSIHHRLVAEALEILGESGYPIVAPKEITREDGSTTTELRNQTPHDIALADIHATFARALGKSDPAEVFDAATLNAFQFVRKVRNRLTHQRGIGGPKLVEHWIEAKGPEEVGANGEISFPEDGQELWGSLAKRPFHLPKGREEMILGSHELFATLAITKRLASTVERGLWGALPRPRLADVAVEELFERNPQKAGQTHRIEKVLENFAAREFPGFGLTELELKDAYERYLAGKRQGKLHHRARAR